MVKTEELRRSWHDKVAGLDFDLIIQEVIGVKDRSEIPLIEEMSEEDHRQICRLLEKRATGVPLAYILERKNFFGYDFFVNENVLIPRPETEVLVEEALEIISQNARITNIADVGCGSGAIGIALALEHMKFHKKVSCVFTAIDINSQALEIAKNNAKKHHVDIKFLQSDLLDNVESKFDLILANLPYVDKNWHWLDENQLKFEPDTALYAEDGGLALVCRLLQEAKDKTSTSAFILLEVDPSQQERLSHIAEELGYEYKKSLKSDYVAILRKI